MENKNIGADGIKWDLGFMYSGGEDSRINKDIAELESLAERFAADYKGKLAEKVGGAIADYSAIKMLSDKIMVFLFLRQSLEVANDTVKARLSEAEQKLNRIHGE